MCPRAPRGLAAARSRRAARAPRSPSRWRSRCRRPGGPPRPGRGTGSGRPAASARALSASAGLVTVRPGGRRGRRWRRGPPGPPPRWSDRCARRSRRAAVRAGGARHREPDERAAVQLRGERHRVRIPTTVNQWWPSHTCPARPPGRCRGARRLPEHDGREMARGCVEDAPRHQVPCMVGSRSLRGRVDGDAVRVGGRDPVAAVDPCGHAPSRCGRTGPIRATMAGAPAGKVTFCRRATGPGHREQVGAECVDLGDELSPLEAEIPSDRDHRGHAERDPAAGQDGPGRPGRARRRARARASRRPAPRQPGARGRGPSHAPAVSARSRRRAAG